MIAGRPLIRFATSNANKAEEARRLLGVAVEPVHLALEEIQAATLEEIVIAKLERARLSFDGPLLVEDVALGFDALGGFPGPYVKWLLEAAGGEGLATIARSLGSCRAAARCALAFWNGSSVSLFVGETAGEIITEPRGQGGFGWDAWFLAEASGRTYAEMTGPEKDEISHRGKAFALLRRFLSSAV
ncbi:MAG: non-canonical purine NTP pyrophosphatase [Thermoanaerobaculia bacterium]